MPIDTVVAGIDLAADKPFGIGHMALHHGVPFPEPCKVAGHLAPKARRIILRPIPHRFILLLAADIRSGGKGGWWRKGASFPERALDTLISRLRLLEICSWAIKGVVKVA